MTEPSKPRMAIDLDDLERQLLRSAEQPAPKKDPLAELARIVGQDDPFRKLLGDGAASASRRSEAHVAQAAATLRPSLTPEDESVLHGHAQTYADPAQSGGFDADQYAEPPYEPLEPVHGGYAGPDLSEPEPARSRKPLYILGAILGAAILGGAGYAMLRGGGARLASNGEPPLVRADTTPSKIAPQNPGGVEIPNQNKQIFERGAQDSQSRVVDRQEQPVDVRQAARSMPSPPPEAGPRSSASGGQGATNPGGANAPGAPRPNAVTSALGEPRRVRTVAVKPDGTIDTPSTGSTASGGDAPTVVSPTPLPSVSSPPPASTGSRPTSSATPAQSPPASAAPARPLVAPPAATASSSSSAPASPAPAATPPSPPRTEPQRTEPQRMVLPENPPLAFPPATRPPAQVAAVPVRPPAAEPVRPAPEPARTTPEPARAAPSQSATGGFSVQIGTRPSEEEARAAFEQLSARYASVLAGHQPVIRKAELNGKTVYRVRVGPASARAEAVELCVKLKAAGGECFVAAN